MLLPIFASVSLVVLSTLFVYALAEQLLKKIYGEDLFHASFYLNDLCVYAGFGAFLTTLRFASKILLSTNASNVATLITILSVGYYLTFRGILLSLFTRQFTQTLQEKYGSTEGVSFDGSTARYHSSTIIAYVAQHFYKQVDTSNRVVIPTGVVWVIFLLTASFYLPALFISVFTTASFIAVVAGILSTFALLPNKDSEKAASFMQCSPVGCLIPSATFLSLFVTVTPLIFNAQTIL